MKLFPSLLAFLCISSRLLALDAAELATVAAKFSDPSGDVQYAARIELHRAIDAATAPGGSDRASAIRAVEELLAKPETSTEAKKYLLRALALIGTPESVPAAAAIFRGSDAMLKEEARQVLATLGTPEAIGILTEALTTSSAPRERAGLLDSLALTRAGKSVPAIVPLIANADPAVARAAVASLGRIGGAEAIAALGKSHADAKLAPLKPEIEKALLTAAHHDSKTVRDIYQSTASPEVKLAAFLILAQAESSAEIIQDALKSGDASLRLAALKRGLELNLPDLLKGGLDREADPFSNSERLLILANLPLHQPADSAVEIGVGALKSESAEEKALAITALGRLGGKPAFDAIFDSLAISEPTVARALGHAIARIDAPGADEFLLEKIQGAASREKTLAIKAAASRSLSGVRPMLVQIIQTGEKDSSQEAMKTLYAIGGIEELKALCAAASSATDPKLRGSLTSFCKRLATRLATDEAKQLAEALKAE